MLLGKLNVLPLPRPRLQCPSLKAPPAHADLHSMHKNPLTPSAQVVPRRDAIYRVSFSSRLFFIASLFYRVSFLSRLLIIASHTIPPSKGAGGCVFPNLNTHSETHTFIVIAVQTVISNLISISNQKSQI